MQVGKRGRERSDTRGRDLSARDSTHSTTLGSVCIATRPRTPGNVSHTVLYDAIFLLHGTACADFDRAGEACAMHKNPPFSQVNGDDIVIPIVLQTTLIMRTRTLGRYRSTNDSVMKSERSSLVRGSDLPKCHSAHTLSLIHI